MGSPIATPREIAPAEHRGAAEHAEATPPTLDASPEALKDAIVASLDGDKAEDITVIDLRGHSSIADFMVIASGRSTRQVGAMAGHIVQRLQPLLSFTIGAEGVAQGDWALLDCGDVIVHLFRPEVRAFYAIEKMWGLEPPRPPLAMEAGLDG